MFFPFIKKMSLIGYKSKNKREIIKSNNNNNDNNNNNKLVDNNEITIKVIVQYPVLGIGNKDVDELVFKFHKPIKCDYLKAEIAYYYSSTPISSQNLILRFSDTLGYISDDQLFQDENLLIICELYKLRENDLLNLLPSYLNSIRSIRKQQHQQHKQMLLQKYDSLAVLFMSTLTLGCLAMLQWMVFKRR